MTSVIHYDVTGVKTLYIGTYFLYNYIQPYFFKKLFIELSFGAEKCIIPHVDLLISSHNSTVDMLKIQPLLVSIFKNDVNFIYFR